MMHLALGLRRFRRGLTPVNDPEALRLLGTMAARMGVREAVWLYAASDETTPMTFGWRRPVIVVPEALLDDAPALRLTFRHELIHIRRRDYAVGWVVRLVTALFAIHPGVWLLRRHIDQYREISCDAETLAEAPGAARQYAHLLVRFAPLPDLAGPAALRMVEPDSTLKKRIHAMHHTARFSTRLRRWSLPLAAALLLFPAVLAACATENTTEADTVVVRDAEERAAQAIHEELAEELALREVALEQLRREQALHDAERAAKEVEELRRRRQQTSAATGDLEFKRLTAQMEYLQKEIKKVSKAVEEMEGSPEREMIYQRVQLLNAMYMQRLERYETIKMERFTEAALAEGE